jgi:hypothetical protein
MRSPDEITPEELAETHEPPAPIEPAERYPLSLPKRRQILPDGTAVFELGAELSHLAQPMISAIVSGIGVHGGLAIGSTEIVGGASFTPSASQDAPEDMQLEFPAFRSLGGGVRTDVGGDAVLEIGFLVGFVGSDYQRYLPGISLTKKAHLSDRAAIVAGGGLEYERGQTSTGIEYAPFGPYRRFGASVFVSIEASLSRNVSLLAGTSMMHNEQLEAPSGDASYRTYQTRLALLIAASESIDVWFGWNLVSSGTVDQKTLSVSFDVRRFQ